MTSKTEYRCDMCQKRIHDHSKLSRDVTISATYVHRTAKYGGVTTNIHDGGDVFRPVYVEDCCDSCLGVIKVHWRAFEREMLKSMAVEQDCPL